MFFKGKYILTGMGFFYILTNIGNLSNVLWQYCIIIALQRYCIAALQYCSIALLFVLGKVVKA